jgi:hypothetical protein
MRRVLNYLLAISFILTIMVPITGIIVHKLASTLFLVLALIHVFLYRKRLDLRFILIIVLTILSFVLGILGLVLVEYPIMLTLHRTVSIVLIILLAIHIYINFIEGLPSHNVTALIIFKVMANMMTVEDYKLLELS